MKLNQFHNNYCWYAGDYGESCTDACASHDGVNADTTWNDDSSCTVSSTLLGGCSSGCNGDYADGRAPTKQDDGWCFYRKTDTGVNVMPGVPPKEYPDYPIWQKARRVCACNN